MPLSHGEEMTSWNCELSGGDERVRKSQNVSDDLIPRLFGI
jgi:hypothetical protein